MLPTIEMKIKCSRVIFKVRGFSSTSYLVSFTLLSLNQKHWEVLVVSMEETKAAKVNLQDNASLLNNMMCDLCSEEVQPPNNDLVRYVNCLVQQVGVGDIP